MWLLGTSDQDVSSTGSFVSRLEIFLFIPAIKNKIQNTNAW